MNPLLWSAPGPSAYPIFLLAMGIAVFAATVMLTGAVLVWLRRNAILDRPNDRSSHTIPTPRGGGLGMVPPVVLGLAMVPLAPGGGPGLLLPALAAALAWYCWRDDRGGLPAGQRFAMQALAVAIGLAALPEGPVFQGWLPFWLDRVIAGIGWLWFLNLYNFMDGIDGITGVETASLGAGLMLVGGGLGLPGAILLGAGAGFLIWNWQPARLFMGDVGSVPLGYILGGLLLSLAAQGLWVAALVLPLYYLADATLTLLVRVFRRERFWQAHRTHFYQRAVAGDLDHAMVCRRVLLCNLVLIGLATLSSRWPIAALAGAVVAVLALLAVLHRSGLHRSGGTRASRRAP